MEEIQSPCIGVCAMDEVTGLCQGCYRTMDEIQAWWDLDSTQKQAIINITTEREAQLFE